VHLPFEREVSPFAEQAFEHGTSFTRLHRFVLTSDTYIVAPPIVPVMKNSLDLTPAHRIIFDVAGPSALPAIPTVRPQPWFHGRARQTVISVIGDLVIRHIPRAPGCWCHKPGR
jgi:hypothetical protein